MWGCIIAVILGIVWILLLRKSLIEEDRELPPDDESRD